MGFSKFVRIHFKPNQTDRSRLTSSVSDKGAGLVDMGATVNTWIDHRDEIALRDHFNNLNNMGQQAYLRTGLR
jgi:hypothetical protein